MLNSQDSKETQINISLTSELEQFIEAKVKTGFYHSASEVVREGLRILVEQDAIKEKRLAMLSLEIDQGIAALESGRIVSDRAYEQHRIQRRQGIESSHG